MPICCKGFNRTYIELKYVSITAKDGTDNMF